MANYETSKHAAAVMTAVALLGASAFKGAEAQAAVAATPEQIVHIDNSLASNTSENVSEAGPINLHNFQPLYNVLLPKQFNAVFYDLSTFLQDRIDPSIEEANLSHFNNGPKGTLTFTVSAEGAHHKVAFQEIVDRHIWNKLAVSIPSYHYHKTIKVY